MNEEKTFPVFNLKKKNVMWKQWDLVQRHYYVMYERTIGACFACILLCVQCTYCSCEGGLGNVKYKQEEVEIIAVYHNSCILASSIHLLMPAPQLKQEVCEKKKKKKLSAGCKGLRYKYMVPQILCQRLIM